MMTPLMRPLCPLFLVAVCCLIQADTLTADEKVKINDITLSVPENWKQKPASNRLRLAQFDIPATEEGIEAAELVVYSFGGGGGGIDANIKRWIDQFEAEGRRVKLTQGTSDQGPYVLVDLRGTYNQPVGPPILRKTKPLKEARMLAVILQIKDKGNYFLKLTGDDKTVTKEETALRKSYGADADKEKAYELPDA